jgi:FtsP/CotA-like multicopper oxidase with cupredoxin domain
MGLAAFYILKPAPDDTDELDLLDLPGRTASPPPAIPEGPLNPDTQLGMFDLPLVIQDRVFGADNQLIFNPFDFDGLLGDTFLVNGVIQPFFQVQPRKYRLRFLNGSNARVYQLAFSMSDSQALSPLPSIQVGSDGGLLPKAVRRDSFLIAMAERIEVVFDFAPFRRKGGLGQVFLVNCMQQTSGRGPDGVTPEACTPLVRFDVQDMDVTDPVVLKDGDQLLPLRDDKGRDIDEIILPQERATAVTREFKFERSHGGWVINGEFFQGHIVSRDGQGNFVRPKLESVEIWRLENSSGGWVHPIHLHMEEFQLLDRNGNPPLPEEAGLKDVFYLGQGESVRVFTRFRHQPSHWRNNGGEDNDGMYVFHCHNLEHEDMHMMGNFEVLP